MTGSFYAAGLQITGDRESQQDSFAIHDLMTGARDRETSLLLLLADGMGGHRGGETASRTAIETFGNHYLTSQGKVAVKLQEALTKTTEELAAIAEGNISLRKMGTTLVAVAITPDSMQWLSVGDSLLWLFRNGRLIRLNEDHSMAAVLQDMVEIGRMTQEEVDNAPNRHALRSIVSAEESAMVDIRQTPYVLDNSDLLILASDGVQTLSEERIGSILQENENRPLAEIAGILLRQVESVKKKNQDNTTVVLYRVP